MTSNEFTLWLHGYLEALETEGIEKIKIKNIREKMSEIKNFEFFQIHLLFLFYLYLEINSNVHFQLT